MGFQQISCGENTFLSEKPIQLKDILLELSETYQYLMLFELLLESDGSLGIKESTIYDRLLEAESENPNQLSNIESKYKDPVSKEDTQTFKKILEDVKKYSKDKSIVGTIIKTKNKNTGSKDKFDKLLMTVSNRLDKIIKLIEKYLQGAIKAFSKIINWFGKKFKFKKNISESYLSYRSTSSGGMLSQLFFVALVLLCASPAVFATAFGVSLASGGIGTFAALGAAMLIAIKKIGGIQGIKNLLAKGGGSLEGISVATYQTSTVSQSNRTG